MFLNIYLGITYSHLPGTTGLYGHTLFLLICWGTGMARTGCTFFKGMFLVCYGKCSQARCCTHKTQRCISKWQFLHFKPTFFTASKWNEEHKHSLVNLHTHQSMANGRKADIKNHPLSFSEHNCCVHIHQASTRLCYLKFSLKKVCNHITDY